MVPTNLVERYHTPSDSRPRVLLALKGGWHRLTGTSSGRGQGQDDDEAGTERPMEIVV